MARLNWSEIIEAAVLVIRGFVERGTPPTVRTVHYALVSKRLIPNTRSAYQMLSRKLVEARKDGVVKWEWISDETRSTLGLDWSHWEPDEYVDYVMKRFDSIGEYHLPRWLDQDWYVELWIEKAALAKTVHRWISDRNVVIVPCRGYSSWTFIREAAARIANRLYELVDDPTRQSFKRQPDGSYVAVPEQRVVKTGKEAVILYYGDFDPSGRDIERFIEEALSWFKVDVDVKHIAITREQIEEYDLPHRPEDSGEVAKLRRDPRFKSWPWGLYAVELDALMAYVPDDFERIVKESVDEYFDEDIYEGVQEKESGLREEVWDKLKERMEKRFS